MRKLLLLLTIISFAMPLLAQNKELKEVVRLQMPDDPGERASSIAWHPFYKKYYAPKSGNAGYTLAIFDAEGKNVSPQKLNTGFDIRGFWYNPALKTFSANGYNDNGWMTYVLDQKGIPVDIQHDVLFMNQPDAQSVGSYDAANNLTYFLKGQFVVAYNATTHKEVKRTRLFVNATDEEEAVDVDLFFDVNETPENVNYTTVIYTGIPKAEFALLNVDERTIDFYDSKTGIITKQYDLPFGAPADRMLCFSYANEFFWLFDIKTKIWHGYK